MKTVAVGKLAIKESAASLIQSLRPEKVARYLGIPPGNILYYHRVHDREDDLLKSGELTVSVRNFEDQIRFLRSNYNVMPLDTFVEKWREKSLSFFDIAITFDDGYSDNYSYAYPILKKHDVPATIFLTTAYIGGNEPLWWDKAGYIFRCMREGRSSGMASATDLPDDIKKLCQVVARPRYGIAAAISCLKRMTHAERQRAISSLEQLLSVENVLPSLGRIFLSREEIREMSRNGIDFGAHTHTHPALIDMSLAESRDEIVKSKKIIEELIGLEVKAFAYPDGCLNEDVKCIVSEAGYSYALQTTRYIDQFKNDIFAIPRRQVKEGHSKGISGSFSAALFSFELLGLGDLLFQRSSRRVNPYANHCTL